MNGVAVKLLAAYLGLSDGHVRKVIRAHQIQPIGTAWKAKLYDPAEVLRHAGAHHRKRASTG